MRIIICVFAVAATVVYQLSGLAVLWNLYSACTVRSLNIGRALEIIEWSIDNELPMGVCEILISEYFTERKKQNF